MCVVGGIWANDGGGDSSQLSFLYESAATTETIGRYSFVGAGMFTRTICLKIRVNLFFVLQTRKKS